MPSAARAESIAVQARRDSLRRAALRARAAARIDSAQRPAAAESRNARSTRLDVLDIMRLRDSLAGGTDSSSQR
jgi:hypothetical protein